MGCVLAFLAWQLQRQHAGRHLLIVCESEMCWMSFSRLHLARLPFWRVLETILAAERERLESILTYDKLSRLVKVSSRSCERLHAPFTVFDRASGLSKRASMSFEKESDEVYDHQRSKWYSNTHLCSRKPTET